MTEHQQNATEIVAQAIAETEGLPSHTRAKRVVAALRRAGALRAREEDPNAGDWFYPGDDTGSEFCEDSVHDAARAAWEADASSRIVQVSRAAKLPSVWVLVTPDADDSGIETEAFRTKAEAQAALTKRDGSA